MLFCLYKIICTTTTLLTCTWITFEYQYTFRTRSFGVLSTTDAIMDWKEYLSLSLSHIITSSYACQMFTLSGPSSREQLIHFGMMMNCDICWGRLFCLFVCLFQLCSVRYGEVTSSRLCRWCVIEVTQVYFSFVSSTIQITFFWILSHFVIFVYY